MGRRPRDGLAIDTLLLVVGKLAVGAWILHLGFSHVSDDDYARTVIAERFARSPTLDPSGTSWLPLPFWLEGGAMMVFGRSLATARGVAVTLGALAVAPVYVAMRAAKVPRLAAVLATVFGMLAPWDAWLAVATVPEGWSGALIAAAAVTVPLRHARPWGALALLVASLSRYEAWPVCGVLALAAVAEPFRSARSPRRGAEAASSLVPAAIALAGPLLWIGWNAHAHDGPLHFLTRVTTFRQATALGATSSETKLFEYPRALITGSSELLALAAVGGVLGLPDKDYRRRWAAAAAPVAVMIGFLVYGAARDAAPTHHPERTLTAVNWVLAGLAADGACLLLRAWTPTLMRARGVWLAGALGAAAALSVSLLARRWPEYPGQTRDERRMVQTTRGLALRRQGARALEITPCAYEHFALVAAFGAPENTTVLPASGESLNEDCPHVVVR
jgi:hypothetical protein